MSAAMLVLVCQPGVATSQSFVRVSDPANPVVNDTFLSGGGCWLDLVGDGYLDLFVANGNLSNQPNALYRNTRGGGFVKVVTGPVVGDGGSSIGGTLGDFDNDGFTDLFVTNRNNFGNFLYRGLGDTAFVRVPTGAPATDIANSNSSSWVDVDNDGVLDLYIVNFQGNDFFYHGNGAPVVHVHARRHDRAHARAPSSRSRGRGRTSMATVVDDLFVGNAGAQNDYLYTNHGPAVVHATGVHGRPVHAGGELGRLRQRRLARPVGDALLGPDEHALPQQRSADLRAHAGGRERVSPASPATGWAAAGATTTTTARSICSSPTTAAASALYHNDGPPGYGFTKIRRGSDRHRRHATRSARCGATTIATASSTCSWPTTWARRIASTTTAAPPITGSPCAARARRRIAVRSAPRCGYGRPSRGAARWQLREVTSQTGYNSGNLDQHFGLGDATLVDSLRVEWPSGRRDTWAGLAVDALRTLVEDTGTVSVEPAEAESGVQLERPRPDPCHGQATLAFTLPRAGHVRLDVFDVRGRRVLAVIDRWQPAGRQELTLTLPASAAAGIYFCRLATDERTRTTRLLLTR